MWHYVSHELIDDAEAVLAAVHEGTEKQHGTVVMYKFEPVRVPPAAPTLPVCSHACGTWCVCKSERLKERERVRARTRKGGREREEGGGANGSDTFMSVHDCMCTCSVDCTLCGDVKRLRPHICQQDALPSSACSRVYVAGAKPGLFFAKCAIAFGLTSFAHLP